MSVSALSETLQRRILQNIIDNSIKEYQAAQKLPSLDTWKKLEYQQATRFLGEPNQIAAFSKQALVDLAADFNEIVKDINKITISTAKIDKGTNRLVAAKLGNAPALKNHLKNKDIETELKSLAEQASTFFSAAQNTDLFENFQEFLKAKEYVVSTTNSDVLIVSAKSGATLPHGKFNELFKEFSISKLKQEPYLAEFINLNVDTGHLLGAFNQRLFRAFGEEFLNATYSTVGSLQTQIAGADATIDTEAALDKLNSTVSAAFNIMEYVDFLSSSLKTTPQVFAELSKKIYQAKKISKGSNGQTITEVLPPEASIEIQVSWFNQQIGRELTAAGTQLSNVVKAYLSSAELKALGIDSAKVSPVSFDSVTNQKKYQAAVKELETFFKTLQKLADTVKVFANKLPIAENASLQALQKEILSNVPKISNILINSEGSDSYLTALGKGIGGLLGGKVPRRSDSKTKKALESKQKVPTKKKANVSKAKPKIIGQLKSATAKAINNLNNLKRAKISVEQTLTSLQNVINIMLHEQIRQNMGTGNRRDVLNYRTGRFAQSAQVERISQGREGMITAYYTYMKYPYATFSEGGRQQFPRSRDPKLLISKSIREIMQQQMITRMRAQLI